MNDSEKMLKALGEIQSRLGQLDSIQNQMNTMQSQLDRQGKHLEDVRGDVSTLKGDVSDIKQSQAQTNTALEALGDGQKDIREKMATKEETADKADITNLRTNLAKTLKGHEQRISTIEDKLNLPHTNKN